MASFYEFFSGGGMARAGLGDEWRCLFANDFDPKKGASYAANWGGDQLKIGDVASLTANDLSGEADLVWASFPCQDLSLAGAGAGLMGERSGTFWQFWKLVRDLRSEGRAPKLVVLENVCGAMTSHSGKDFVSISDALAEAGYRFGAVVVDAVHFVPHSRPRLFFIAAHEDVRLPKSVSVKWPHKTWHSTALLEAYGKLSAHTRDAWIWWNLPAPPNRDSTFADLIEEEPLGVMWHTPDETNRLLGMMSSLHLAKVEAAKQACQRKVGAIYKRTRFDGATSKKVQRAEIRFDDVAGCLRTPTGGSSRQMIMIVDGENVRSRLLSPREAARLMGLSDEYQLPSNYNDAYHLAGDGVAVPVVSFLAKNLLEPILSKTAIKEAA